MSKQAKAKEEQGYKVSGPNCGNCRNFTSEMVPIKWMADKNALCAELGESPRYNLPSLQPVLAGEPERGEHALRHWRVRHQEDGVLQPLGGKSE